MRTLMIGAAVMLSAACAGAPRTEQVPAPTQPPPAVLDQATLNPAAQARADGGIARFVEADVKFMQGMIHHHAQAILISKWAPSHGASDRVQLLAEKIIVSQRDEIAMMQDWLRVRKQEVPPADTLPMKADDHSAHAGHNMPGMSHGPVVMPGMLSQSQLAQLDSARGRAFDRLFLTLMIQHHEGAIAMVKELFATTGAANDVTIYRFAADVEADQGTEIQRMSSMLAAMPSGGGSLSTPRREY